MSAATAPTTEAQIWSRIVQPDEDPLTPTAEESPLRLKFAEQDLALLNDLAQKNREGLQSEEERKELESYVRVGDIVALLHLQARRAMELRPGDRAIAMHASVRAEVRRRALDRCEHCHLPDAHDPTPFQVEHVVARQHRGSDKLINMAYSCLRCNLHKT
jgi:hypothetical protein